MEATSGQEAGCLNLLGASIVLLSSPTPHKPWNSLETLVENLAPEKSAFTEP